MHNNNTIKLLKLQGKNLKIEKEIIDDINNEAYFFISRKIKPCKCPHCNTITKHVHDYRDQYIRHSPINGFKTFLVLHKARLICPNCYHKFYANYSDIVNPRFRCSNILFFDIINTLKDTSMTFDEVANFFGVSSGVVTRYLDFFSYLMEWNNITCLPKHIGIDEFKGNCDASKYLFHIYDLDTNQTIYILKSRKYDDVVKFFNNISIEMMLKLLPWTCMIPLEMLLRLNLKGLQLLLIDSIILELFLEFLMNSEFNYGEMLKD